MHFEFSPSSFFVFSEKSCRTANMSDISPLQPALSATAIAAVQDAPEEREYTADPAGFGVLSGDFQNTDHSAPLPPAAGPAAADPVEEDRNEEEEQDRKVCYWVTRESPAVWGQSHNRKLDETAHEFLDFAKSELRYGTFREDNGCRIVDIWERFREHQGQQGSKESYELIMLGLIPEFDSAFLHCAPGDLDFEASFSLIPADRPNSLKKYYTLSCVAKTIVKPKTKKNKKRKNW